MRKTAFFGLTLLAMACDYGSENSKAMSADNLEAAIPVKIGGEVEAVAADVKEPTKDVLDAGEKPDAKEDLFAKVLEVNKYDGMTVKQVPTLKPSEKIEREIIDQCRAAKIVFPEGECATERRIKAYAAGLCEDADMTLTDFAPGFYCGTNRSGAATYNAVGLRCCK